MTSTKTVTARKYGTTAPNQKTKTVQTTPSGVPHKRSSSPPMPQRVKGATYSQMLQDAIYNDTHHDGPSLASLKHYLKHEYGLEVAAAHQKTHLKKILSDKSVFIKNGSRYQLTPAKRKELKAIDDQESENEVESSPEPAKKKRARKSLVNS